jgi:hypothetical protein
MKGVDFEDFQVLFEAYTRCHQSSSYIKSFGGHFYEIESKGGFFSERADAFVISPNRQT